MLLGHRLFSSRTTDYAFEARYTVDCSCKSAKSVENPELTRHTASQNRLRVRYALSGSNNHKWTCLDNR